MPASFLAELTQRLALLKEGGLGRLVPPVDERRGPLVHVAGRWLVDFSANDALGLGSDPDLARRLWQQVRPRRLGAGAARLVSGDSPELRRAEAALAELGGAPTGLLFPSATQANAAVASLLRPEDTVVVDGAVHGSIRHGLAAARCQVRAFRRHSLAHLERILGEGAPALVWTETLFSMDGHTPDLPALACLCQRHHALLVLDEAHAVGALGPGGAGLGAGFAPVRTLGLGKALGLVGGAVLGPPEVREALLHLAPPAMFTTAVPPWLGELVAAMVEEVRRREPARQRLAQLAAHARTTLARAGLPVMGDHHILAVPVGNETQASAAASQLQERGYLVFAARYPTVPLGAARLRLVVAAHHEPDHIDGLAAALAEILTSNGAPPHA